ncbi:MAG: glycosyltransferase family 39 protein [Elainellaceae cyanobacterium]
MSSASIERVAQRTAAWIDRYSEGLLLLGLTGAALLIFTLNLGTLPLRDWDEGTVAGVARELYRLPLSQWLYPILHGEPYFNKPPLIHGLIALSFRTFGVSEWAARLPGALLGGLSVPLLYLVGRELWPGRLTALLGSTVYLASLPVVRHGRLAMLDGASVCFFLVMLLSLLRSRRQPYWSLGAGLGLSLMLLTKGALGLLLGGIGLGFMVWDSPRFLRSIYLWIGLLLGLLPAVGWYLLQGLRYGSGFWMVHLFDQSLNRVWTAVEQNQGPPWFYLLELLKGDWPWLLFVPIGLRAAWRDRWRSWGKLLVLWTLGYLAVISSMGTKLPWYVFPLYPVLSLLAGVELRRLWQTIGGYSAKLTPTYRYSLGISLGLGLVAMVSWAGCVYFAMAGDSLLLALSLGIIGLTMSAALWRLGQRDSLFVPLLIWGMYLSLLPFVASPHWVWELAEDYPVKPVAALIQAYVPPEAKVLTSHPNHRPSLDFYSDRRVVPAGNPQLRRQWQRGAYLLLDEAARQRPWVNQSLVLDQVEGWSLLAPPPKISSPPRLAP